MAPHILLTRIDNRLLHGQGITWATTYGANLVVVANDEIVGQSLAQELMMITAESSGFGIRFFSIEKTIGTIHKASPTQHIYLICRTPSDVVRLLKGGVDLEVVNVGNMHFSAGKRQISKKVYVNDEDWADLKYISEHVAELFIQDVPGEVKEKLDFNE